MSAGSVGHRSKVLSMYRHVLRLSRTYMYSMAFSPGEPSSERQYIKDEVQKLVRRNKFLSDTKQIKEKVHEFETRIETGVHYKIPYPRPVNVAPGSTGKDPETVTPVYLHSYKHGSSKEVSSRRKINVPVYEE